MNMILLEFSSEAYGKAALNKINENYGFPISEQNGYNTKDWDYLKKVDGKNIWWIFKPNKTFNSVTPQQAMNGVSNFTENTLSFLPKSTIC